MLPGLNFRHFGIILTELRNTAVYSLSGTFMLSVWWFLQQKVITRLNMYKIKQPIY